MEIKSNVFTFKEVVNGREYLLVCSQESPLGELHDVLMKMKGYTVERMQQAQQQEQDIKDKMCEIEATQTESA